MSRILLAASAAVLLLVPATAVGSTSAHLRGTVAQKLPANNLIRVDSRRTAHILQVSGSQARIRVGQRVELRGSTLRQRGNGSRVLARNVVVVRSVVGDTSPASSGTPASKDDDNSGPARADDDGDDNSGPGRADDDDDDKSGPGNGNADDTDDDSGDDDNTDDD
jgi:hypothetical protein